MRRSLLILACIMLLAPANMAAQQFTVGNYKQVSAQRVSLYQYDYTYRASVTSHITSGGNVEATLISTVPYTLVVVNTLSFGKVPALATVTSVDTFTIRHDHRYPFSWWNLRWTCTTTATSARTVGPRGGRLSFLNGVILDIPAGAVKKLTRITLGDLPAPQVEKLFAARKFASAQKRFLGGFRGEPDGLVFNVPIKATVPVLPLNPGGIPVQAKVDLQNKEYWLAPTNLLFRPSENLAEIVIQGFSWNIIVELSSQLSERAACRTGRIYVEAADLDFGTGKGCQVLSSYVKVTFLDCPGAPWEKSTITETTPECGDDFRVSVKVAPPQLLLRVCGGGQFTATVQDQNEKPLTMPIIWENTNQPDAGVIEKLDQDGNVLADGREGMTLVAAKCPDARYYGQGLVTVVGTVCRINIDPGHGNIRVGQTLPLSLIASPNGLGKLTPTWGSNRPDVAKIDSVSPPGVSIKGVGPGDAIVTATLTDVDGFSLSDEASIHVVTTLVEISPSEPLMRLGQSLQLNATQNGKPVGSSTPISWSSSDESIAKVDEAGLVTGWGVGKAEITATIEGVSGTATITVGVSTIREAPVVGPDEITTASWSIPFPDTNYTAVCSNTDPDRSNFLGIEGRTPNGLSARVSFYGDGADVHGPAPYECIGIHDTDADVMQIRYFRGHGLESPDNYPLTWNRPFPNGDYTPVCRFSPFGWIVPGSLGLGSMLVDVRNESAGDVECIAKGDSEAEFHDIHAGRATTDIPSAPLGGTGLSHVRVEWDTPFAGTDYVAACTDENPMTILSDYGGITARSSAWVEAWVGAGFYDPPANETITMHCIGVPR